MRRTSAASKWVTRTSATSGLWLALTGALFIALPPGSAAAATSPLGRALSDLAENLEKSPRDVGLLNDYGNLLVHAGFLDEAEMAYESALELAPESLAAHYNLGLLHLELGRPRTAERRFRRALKIDPSFGKAHYGLGSAFDARQRHRRAVKHYSEAFRLEPELLDVRRNPEILFNKLTTWASMHSYLAASAGRAGRLYEDPRPLVGLLVPGIDELLDQANGRPDEEAEAVEETTEPESESEEAGPEEVD